MSRTMPCSPARRFFAPLAVTASALICTLLFSHTAHALYKIVGPDGKITYTDQPPANDNPAHQVTPLNSSLKGGSTPSTANLPFELKKVVTEFPVTIYTLKSDCAPCDQGRQLLKQRGVPFSERAVSSKADIEALKSLTGAQETPVMVIGKQVNKGFSADVWNQYLDLAGYPKTSKLPANYDFGSATPLTQQQSAESIEERPSKAQRSPSSPRPEPGTRASRMAEKNSGAKATTTPPRDPNALQF
jgi:glutaredoxin